MKILYAASNNSGAKIQLDRFLTAIKNSSHIIKVAAYKSSSPENVSIDWTLDCLQNIFKSDHITLNNDNFITYYNQIKYYNPDLIISDLEYFTSYIANSLDITLWQCSSSLINFAISNDYRYNLGLFKKYAFLLNRNPIHTQRTVNMLDNSNCNFVYSHFGDVENSPTLKEDYDWIRPYHQIGKVSIPCQHNIVASSSKNKDIIKLLTNYSDSVYFTDFLNEQYSNIIFKNIANEEEFVCNLKNSNLFVCQGQTSFLAEAFYNQKYCVTLPMADDPESIINSTISDKIGLSTNIYDSSNDLNVFFNLSVMPAINDKIKFLHEKIEDI